LAKVGGISSTASFLFLLVLRVLDFPALLGRAAQRITVLAGGLFGRAGGAEEPVSKCDAIIKDSPTHL
jgi:hypothetical protein